MSEQYLRNFSLTVVGLGVSFDLSQLHAEFQINNAIVGTPKWGTIRIWNLGPDKATQIIREFQRVDLAVSYGDLDVQTVIKGEIAQVAYGRENATDTFLDLMVQDADRAIIWGTVAISLKPGWNDDQVLDSIMKAWESKVDLGYRPAFKRTNANNDGLVLYGAISDALDELCARQNCHWFVEDEELNIVPRDGFIPGSEPPLLTSESGLLGTPILTYQGIQGRCLMNAAIKVGSLVQLRNSDITQLSLKHPILGVTDPGSIVPTLNNPVETYGTYKVLAVTHEGNSRENQWETRFICCDVDNTAFTGGPGLVSVPSGGAL